MMLVNQEQEVESVERCKEEVAQLNATIERGMPEGKEVRAVVRARRVRASHPLRAGSAPRTM